MRGDGSFVGGDVSVEVEGVVAADLPEQLTFLVVNVKSEDLVRVEVSGHGPVEGVTDDLRASVVIQIKSRPRRVIRRAASHGN